MTQTKPEQDSTAVADEPSLPTILVVEDDPGVAELQRRALERNGFHAAIAHSAEEAHQQLAQIPVDLILLDYQLSASTNGIELCRDLSRENGTLPPIILVTGFSSENVLTDAMRLGIRDCIPKSGNYLEQIPETVRTLLRQSSIEKRLEITEARLGALVRASKDAILLLESDGRISFANQTAETMLSLPLQQLSGRKAPQVLNGIFEDEVLNEEFLSGWIAEADGSMIRRETRLGAEAGTGTPVEVTLSRIEASGKQFFSVNIRDLTERYELQHELEKAREYEQQAKELGLVLGNIDRGRLTVTASVMGLRPIRESMPDVYKSLVEEYSNLIEECVEQRVLKISHDVTIHCQRIANRLGFLKAGPRDVIDIHTDVLREKFAPPTVARKAQVYLEEGRIRVLEIMGFLALYFRSRAWTNDLIGGKQDQSVNSGEASQKQTDQRS